MDTQKRFEHVERNPITHEAHRREVLLQITLPVIISVLLVLAAVSAIIFSASQPMSEVSRWAGVSLIWLILPALFIALLILIILIGFVYAISALIRIVPRYACKLQLYFEMSKEKIGQVSNLVTEPIIKIRSSWAAARWIGHRGNLPGDGQ